FISSDRQNKKERISALLKLIVELSREQIQLCHLPKILRVPVTPHGSLFQAASRDQAGMIFQSQYQYRPLLRLPDESDRPDPAPPDHSPGSHQSLKPCRLS